MTKAEQCAEGGHVTSNDLLAACPCGQTPTALQISAEHDQPKYAYVSGDCCGEWEIEYRNGYVPTDQPEAMRLARLAWNGARRVLQIPNLHQVMHTAEDHEACMLAMDEIGIPRADENDKVFSIWGRVMWLARNSADKAANAEGQVSSASAASGTSPESPCYAATENPHVHD